MTKEKIGNNNSSKNRNNNNNSSSGSDNNFTSPLYTLEAELPVALEELAFYVIRRGEKISDINRIIEKQPVRVSDAIKAIMQEVIIREDWNVKLKSSDYNYSDSENLTHGVAYFKIILQGEKDVLEKVSANEIFTENDSLNIYQS